MMTCRLLFTSFFAFTSAANALDSVAAINEIHYNPGSSGGGEFVEVVNQTGLPIDFSGWRLSGGIDFVFPDGAKLEPNAYLVVAAEPASLPGLEEGSLFGPFTGKLANSGEVLRLRNNNDRVMDLVEYNDRAPWPVAADGTGATLAKRDYLGSGKEASGWAHSTLPQGTPGAENFPDDFTLPSPLLINEFSAPGAMFWAEVFNPSETAAPIAGFEFRADSGEIFTVSASAAAVPAGGFSVFDLGVANFRPVSGTSITLAIPSAGGGSESIIDTLRTRTSGVARIPDGDLGEPSLIVLPSDFTRGTANTVTLDDRIVINEIMYHYHPQYADRLNDIPYVESDEQWIELYNRGAEAVDISGWALDEAVSFEFPAESVIAPGGYLVIAGDAVAFAAKFSSVDLAGEFSGNISNQGETVVLRDEVGNVTDRVRYFDRAPWPDAADGNGSSLELTDPDADNNNPGAWAASSNAETASWQDYTFRFTAEDPKYSAVVGDFHELRIGLLNAGVLFLDDLEVIEDPDGIGLPILQNGTFDDDAAWRFLGSHSPTQVVTEGGDSVLRIDAVDNYTYLNNLLETTLKSGSAIRPVTAGTTYEIRFRARWLSGSPQLRFEFYYNKAAETIIIAQPAKTGTPGAANSTRVANAGPTLSDLRHEPVFPDENEPVTVSVKAEDPDGIAAMELFYSVDGADFVGVPMSDAGGGTYQGEIPGHQGASLSSEVPVQFYVAASDSGSASAFAPLAGPESRAIYLINGGNLVTSARQKVTVMMTEADIDVIKEPIRVFSNERLGCTVVHQNDRISYDCQIRFRGSLFSRSSSEDSGLNIGFPATDLFRGRLPKITIRIRASEEAFVKHLINAAGGGLHDNYNDIVDIRGNLQDERRARMELARFSRDYVEGLSDRHGTGGTVYKMEGIRNLVSSSDGTPEGIKTRTGVGFIRNYDLDDLGDNKELYRNVLPINSARDRDDYSAMIAMNKALALEGDALEAAAEASMDVDLWMRQFALMAFLEIGDVYTRMNPHNLNFYARDFDGKVEPMPWDWDKLFSENGQSGLLASPRNDVPAKRNLVRLIERPRILRVYYGHMLHLLDTVLAESYYDDYADELLRRTFRPVVTNATAKIFRRSREAFVRSEIPASFPFTISTPGPVATAGSSVTLAGKGYFDVRNIYIEGRPFPLEVTWLNSTDYEVDVPVTAGMSTITLVARDFEDMETGRASIDVNSTSPVIIPDRTNLVISEIHYHPANDMEEEYIELMNVSPSATLDLTGLRFTDGISFTFPAGTMLAAGERIVVVQNETAFEAAFGTTTRVAGVFEGDDNLRNKNEDILLELGGIAVQQFNYDDDAPWPKSPDGGGASLVLIAPSSAPDHADPASWRASIAGVTPGEAEPTTSFTGDPDADDDGDGLSNFANYALGGNRPYSRFAVRTTAVGRAVFTFPRVMAAEDAKIIVEVSSDLQTWNSGAGILELTEQVVTSTGRDLVSYRTINPIPEGTAFFRLNISAR